MSYVSALSLIFRFLACLKVDTMPPSRLRHLEHDQSTRERVQVQVSLHETTRHLVNEIASRRTIAGAQNTFGRGVSHRHGYARLSQRYTTSIGKSNVGTSQFVSAETPEIRARWCKGKIAFQRRSEMHISVATKSSYPERPDLHFVRLL
ncbi:hypothetical protein LSAT2_003704 [Lamellibrachia satsuma]|nr:hypothetical protein LSAT2_003704 [Lamellibrachia satsuma]